MLERNPGPRAQYVREGIVAHSTVRFAAGAGVLAASLLIAGPNPAHAVADKHGSGSAHDNGDWTNGNRGGAKQGVANVVKDVLPVGGVGGADNDAKPDLDPPPMSLPEGVDTENLAVADTFDVAAPTVLRSAAIVEQPAGDNVVAAAPRTAAPRAGAAGSGYSGQPGTAFRAPRVVIGNGRTPGTHVPTPGPAPEAADTFTALDSPAANAAPAVPEAIEITIPPLPPPQPPVERIRSAELIVGEYGIGTTDTVTDPLAGVAGLFLLPAIGAVLGYRQARAAQSLRESLRR
jgi:hypothetical protein